MDWRAPPCNRRLPAEAYRRADRPVFVTVRAAGTTRPFVDIHLNDAVVTTLLVQRTNAACDVYAYCLMPDHLHLIAAARDNACMLRFVKHFKGASTNNAWRCGWRGRLWQPGFYDYVLRNEDAMRQVYWYVLSNPVRVGLVSDADAYPWSGEPDPYPW
ncbi:MAG: transposase [Deltaproteobacteria bacterium]|nr:transposase [Deltaproteobacteria bacterium]